MAFRESLLAISPPWLVGPVGEAFQSAEGIVIDALADWAWEGVEASMPGVGTPTALGLSGRDMQIERGPNETDAHYAERLRNAPDSTIKCGSPGELLRQLAGWFSPSTDYPIRLVNNAAVWHEYDYDTDTVTMTDVGDNWNWDGDATKWHRGWVIIDASASPTWRPWVIEDDEVIVGDGHVVGITATEEEINALRRIVNRWKPKNVLAEIIITFDASLFERTDTSTPNPDGEYGDPVNRSADAVYLGAAT